MFIISVIAALCSTTASLPQILGNITQLSNITMVLRGSGGVLWCVYGIFIKEYALVVSSSLAVVIEIALFIKTNYCCEIEGVDSLPSDTVPCPTGAGSDSFVSVECVELH